MSGQTQQFCDDHYRAACSARPRAAILGRPGAPAPGTCSRLAARSFVRKESRQAQLIGRVCLCSDELALKTEPQNWNGGKLIELAAFGTTDDDLARDHLAGRQLASVGERLCLLEYAELDEGFSVSKTAGGEFPIGDGLNIHGYIISQITQWG